MFFYPNSHGGVNAFFLGISISIIAFFSACQPDVEKMITQNDVAYLDSLLSEKRGEIIISSQNSTTQDEFRPWKKEHEQVELFVHLDTILYQANITFTLRGTGFRQDNIILDSGFGSISNVNVLSKNGEESLFLSVDSVDTQNPSAVTIRLNRFVRRDENIRLQFSYSLPFNQKLFQSTMFLPFSKSDSDSYFWLDRPEWLPLIPPVLNGNMNRSHAERTEEWQIHVRNGYKAIMPKKIIKETHSDSVSSFYFIGEAGADSRQPDYLAIIPNRKVDTWIGDENVTLHGISENESESLFFAKQVADFFDSGHVSQNWFFWDFPFSLSQSEATFLPSVALFDSTVYPDISNRNIFGIEKARAELALPPAKDYPSLLFTDWLARTSYTETISNERKIVEIVNSKQKLRNEIDLYTRSIFTPQNDSLSFYYDAHQTEKGFLALRYLKSQFDTEVWDAFLSELKRQDFLNEELLKQIISEYSGESISEFWQRWFYEPGFPVIYTEMDLLEDEVSVRMRQIRSHSTLPVHELFIPALIKEADGEKRDTVFHFHTQDTLFRVNEAVKDLIIDPEATVPAFFHHKRDTALISKRLQEGHPEKILPLLNAHTLPGNNQQRKRFQKMMLSDRNREYRSVLLSHFLRYGVAEADIYESALEWDGRSKSQMLQFARTDSSESARNFIRIMKTDEQLFIQMEATISSVIRGMSDPALEIANLAGNESYRDIKNKTAVYVSAFLDPHQQKNILLNIWNHNSVSDETRIQILTWLENERGIELFQEDLEKRFWESKHLELKKRILKLVATKGEKDFRLAMKKDLLKIAPQYWTILFQKAEAEKHSENDQSRQ